MPARRLLTALLSAVRRGSNDAPTYHITVNMPPAASRTDIGRDIVSAIKACERRSGPGWRR